MNDLQVVLFIMIFSKSFGYALRGILYVALKSEYRPVQLDEIANELGAPRHFMGKIMKRVVQKKILSSLKGPTGGFMLNESTLLRPLVDVYQVTDHPEDLDKCVLGRGPCDHDNPCRLHDLVAPMKPPIQQILFDTTIGDLLAGDNTQLLKGLSVAAVAIV